ncbi:MAG: hypothetical protein ABI626_09040 [Sphingomicrobium sp.]
MRALILVAGAALAVSACSSNDAADNTMNVDENLAAENIVADNTMDANMDANMSMNASDMNASTDMNADANATANMATNNAM